MAKPVDENQSILDDATSNLMVSITIMFAFAALLLLGVAVAFIVTFLPWVSDLAENIAHSGASSVLMPLGSAALGISVSAAISYGVGHGKNFKGLLGFQKQSRTPFSVLHIVAAEDGKSLDSVNETPDRPNDDSKFLNLLNERAKAWPETYRDGNSKRKGKITTLLPLVTFGMAFVSVLFGLISKPPSGFRAYVTPFPAMWVFSLSIVILFGILLIAYFGAQRRRVSVGRFGYESVNEPVLAQFLKGGLVVWPSKVRTNYSYNIYSAFELPFPRNVAAAGSEPPQEGESDPSGEYVEVELQAAGLKVDGDKQRRLCDTSPVAILSWNCCFGKPGRYTVNLVISSVKSPGDARTTLFTKKHDVVAGSARKDLVPTVITLALSAILIVTNLANILRGFL